MKVRINIVPFTYELDGEDPPEENAYCVRLTLPGCRDRAGCEGPEWEDIINRLEKWQSDNELSAGSGWRLFPIDDDQYCLFDIDAGPAAKKECRAVKKAVEDWFKPIADPTKK